MSSEASTSSADSLHFAAPPGAAISPDSAGLKERRQALSDQAGSASVSSSSAVDRSDPSRPQGSRKATSAGGGRSVVPPPILDQLVAVLAASLPLIKLDSDTLLSPAEVTELLPRRRRGRKAHKSTIFRWMSRGYRGLRLPFVQVGHQRCTSINALSAFLSALTAISRFEQGEPLPAILATSSTPPPVRASRANDRLLRTEEEIRRRHGI